MRARQLMRAPVITVHADATVKEAADLMAIHNISGLPVTDASNRLVGIVSESDILTSVDQHGRAPGVVEQLRDAVRGHEATPPRSVRDLMKRRVITAGPDATFRELLHLMMAHRINRVPIVDADQIVGIVTRADLLRTIARPDAAIASDARPGSSTTSGSTRAPSRSRRGTAS